ncbi:MAG: hypothetical protein IKB75_03140 [Clostridia bacterium]|nr:hypothetical protein [Clostridia bacterium]
MENRSRTVSPPTFANEAEKRAFVAACDQQLEDRMEALAARIAEDENLHFIGLTGPSCAGKTTAAHKLTHVLEAHGHRVHVISIDDFYYDKEYLLTLSKNDPEGDIDYDSEATIDVSLLEEKVQSLLEGKVTQLPRFDFHSGFRCDGKIITPEKGDVFLFEGIQILYPSVRAILERGGYRSIYICPASSITAGGVTFAPNRIRLLRRLVRDSIYRSSQAPFTFFLWKSVRENEERNIFPYVHLCNEVLDSTCAYEIGMLKPYLQNLLKDFPRDDKKYEVAQEILSQIADVQEISSDYITENSLYKEFI